MRVANFSQKSYDGGLNNTASPSEINRDEASELHDWDITFQGKLFRRNGLTRVGVFTNAKVNTDQITLSEKVTVAKV